MIEFLLTLMFGWLIGMGTAYLLIKWWLIIEERKEIRRRKKGKQAKGDDLYVCLIPPSRIKVKAERHCPPNMIYFSDWMPPVIIIGTILFVIWFILYAISKNQFWACLNRGGTPRKNLLEVISNNVN